MVSGCNKASLRQQGRGAFTLLELLVVIGIAVLILGIASAAFRTLNGSRSTEAAENIISAMLGRVRNEAIGQQQSRGVIFYTDPTTGRVTMAAVYTVSPVGAVPAQIELVSDEDTQVLPPGVGVQQVTLLPGSPPPTSYYPVGAVMFGANGVLSSMTYTIAVPGSLYNVLTTVPGFVISQSQVMTNVAGFPTAANPATASFAFVAYDQDAYANQAAANQANFLSTYADAELVNRYNGTLVKGQ